jgi:hypothetical protein
MLSIFGLVVIIVATYFVYKTAKEYGRNALLWAVATVSLGIGLQWILPMVMGVVMVFIWAAQGITDPAELQERLLGPAFVITIVGLFVSFIAMWVMLKLVSRLPEQSEAVVPPPPPEFR